MNNSTNAALHQGQSNQPAIQQLSFSYQLGRTLRLGLRFCLALVGLMACAARTLGFTLCCLVVAAALLLLSLTASGTWHSALGDALMIASGLMLTVAFAPGFAKFLSDERQAQKGGRK